MAKGAGTACHARARDMSLYIPINTPGKARGGAEMVARRDNLLFIFETRQRSSGAEYATNYVPVPAVA